jgi:hypothetical protein
MSKLFRNAIENEEKIQKEIQLKHIDVVVSHQVLNFLTPPVNIILSSTFKNYSTVNAASIFYYLVLAFFLKFSFMNYDRLNADSGLSSCIIFKFS